MITTPFHSTLATRLRVARAERDKTFADLAEEEHEQRQERMQVGGNTILPVFDKLKPVLRSGGIDTEVSANSMTAELTITLQEFHREPRYDLTFIRLFNQPMWRCLLQVFEGEKCVDTRATELAIPLTQEIVQSVIENAAVELVKNSKPVERDRQ